MDTSNRRPIECGSGDVVDLSMESSNWRAQLQADSRERIVNRIMDAMKSQIQVSGYKGLQDLKKVAVSFEEKVYIAATSQSDYMRKICFKILTFETKSQNPMPNTNIVNPSYPAIGDSSMESGDWRDQLQADSRQRIINKIIDILKRHLPFSGIEGLRELEKIAVRFENNVYIVATSQYDYLRKISLKMLTLETGSQNLIQSNSNSGAISFDPTFF